MMRALAVDTEDRTSSRVKSQVDRRGSMPNSPFMPVPGSLEMERPDRDCRAGDDMRQPDPVITLALRNGWKRSHSRERNGRARCRSQSISSCRVMVMPTTTRAATRFGFASLSIDQCKSAAPGIAVDQPTFDATRKKPKLRSVYAQPVPCRVGRKIGLRSDACGRLSPQPRW